MGIAAATPHADFFKEQVYARERQDHREARSLSAPATTPLDWRETVAPYVGPHVGRSLLQMATTFIPLAVIFWAMYLGLERHWLLTAALAFPAAGFLVRSFIIMHDCGHSSFLPWRRVSDAVGFVTGVLTLTPFGQWRRDHALHHASSGDLDRRGHGDVPTLTVREYLAKSPRERFTYRLIRHPAALLLGGPFHLAIGQRFRERGLATKDRQAASVLLTNAAIGAGLLLVWLTVGWKAVVFVYFPSYYIAAMAGVWLFYVQHQFEEAYWEPHQDWDYVTAALKGSSHLHLPDLLQWFTGHIGMHHIHHLAPKMPNYRLQRCHDENPVFQDAPVVTVRSGMAALRLALWDEDRQRLSRFDEIVVPAGGPGLSAG